MNFDDSKIKFACVLKKLPQFVDFEINLGVKAAKACILNCLYDGCTRQGLQLSDIWLECN